MSFASNPIAYCLINAAAQTGQVLFSVVAEAAEK
jgi:hypothetical protein